MTAHMRKLTLLALVVAVGGSGAVKAQGSETQGSNALISLIHDDLRQRQLRSAKTALAAGKHAQAIEALQACLRSSPSAVFEVAPGEHIGLRQAARDLLGQLDSKGRAVYDGLVRNEAAPLLSTAVWRRDTAAMTRIALDYPHTDEALTARMLAGDQFLEQGRIGRAWQEFGLAGGDDPRLIARRLACRALLGLRFDTSQLPSTLRLPFAGASLSPAAWEKRMRQVASVSYPVSFWPAYGGGLDGTRLHGEPGNPYVELWQADTEFLGTDPGNSNVHAVADGKRVYVATGTRLCAFDVYAGAEAGWRSPSYLAEEPSYEQDEFLDAANPNMVHAPALGRGIVVAALQVPIVPNEDESSRWGRRRSQRLPVRRLHAFDAATGELIWRHYTGDPDQPDPKLVKDSPLDVSGPPLIVDDTIYVATHRQFGAVALYVAAFDLETGNRKWKTLVCTSQIEANRHGNAYQEFAASPLAFSDGSLFGASHLGLCFSLRVDDGSVRWLRKYPIVPLPVSDRWSRRGFGRRRARLRVLNWANNPPAVAEGVAVFTPIDSDYALALDTKNGRVLWRLPYVLAVRETNAQLGFRWLLGVRDGQAWFSGQAICRVPLRGPEAGTPYLFALPFGDYRGDMTSEIPRGFMTAKHVFFASPSAGLVVYDKDGKVVPKGDLPETEPRINGNLMTSGGVMFAVRAGTIQAFLSAH